MKATLNSQGQYSITVTATEKFIGNYNITQIYGELNTPQMYRIQTSFILSIVPDTSSDAEISEEVA